MEKQLCVLSLLPGFCVRVWVHIYSCIFIYINFFYVGLKNGWKLKVATGIVRRSQSAAKLFISISISVLVLYSFGFNQLIGCEGWSSLLWKWRARFHWQRKIAFVFICVSHQRRVTTCHCSIICHCSFMFGTSTFFLFTTVFFFFFKKATLLLTKCLTVKELASLVFISARTRLICRLWEMCGLSLNVIIDCKRSWGGEKPQITGKQHCIKEQRRSMAVH